MAWQVTSRRLRSEAFLPPIPRGAPAVAIAGCEAGARQGTAHVTLGVRVDERGDVSDALRVESDADSLKLRSAIDAAEAVRYPPRWSVRRWARVRGARRHEGHRPRACCHYRFQAR